MTDAELKKWQLYIRTRVQIDDQTGCWNWTGAMTIRGYGICSIQRKTALVHRASYKVFVGAIPDGLVVRHQCHNKACCNPGHLLVGTAQDNVDDGKRDGAVHQRPVGAQNGMARLTEDAVVEMRHLYAEGQHSQRKLATMFGTTSGQVNAIVNRKSWAHIH